LATSSGFRFSVSTAMAIGPCHSFVIV
jgi:hypothetical protein